MAAENSLVIRIEGDASGANATFTLTEEQLKKLKSSLDDVGSAGKASGRGVAEGAKEMEYSMMEARHGVMLTSEAIGIHVPRAVATMLASLGPVGAVMAAAFPILAVVILIEKIGELIAKHEAAAEAARKSGEAADALAIKENDLVDSLHRANLELADRIAKLEGSPENNKLDIAMSELKEKTDTLAEGFSKDFEKMDKDIADQLGLWESLKRGVSEYMTSVGESQDQSGALSGATAQVAAQNAEVKNSMLGLRESEKAVNDAKVALARAPEGTEAWKTAVGDLAVKYGNLQAASDRALTAVKTASPDNEELINHLRTGVVTGVAGWQAMNEMLDRYGLKVREVADEQDLANEKLAVKKMKDDAKEQEQSDKAAADAQKRAMTEELTNVKDGLNDVLAARKAGDTDRIEAEVSALNELKAKHLEWTEEYKEIERKLTADMDAEQLKRVTNAETIARAQEDVTKAEAKFEEAQVKASTDAQINDLKRQVAERVITQQEANARMVGIYKNDANERVIAQTEVLGKLQTDEVAAQAELQAALESRDTDRITKAEANLDKLKAKELEVATTIVGIWTNADNQIANLDTKNESIREQMLSKYLDKVNTGFAQSAVAVGSHQESLTQAVSQSFKKMEVAAISYFMKMIEQAIISHSIHKALDASEKSSAASVAAVKAGKAVADIPIIGPILAPIAAATVYGAMMAFDRGGMSEGGPALLHPREAVLNPVQAENFRRMTETPSSPTGTTAHFTFSPTINGAFNPDEHGPAMMRFAMDSFKRMGVNL